MAHFTLLNSVKYVIKFIRKNCFNYTLLVKFSLQILSRLSGATLRLVSPYQRTKVQRFNGKPLEKDVPKRLTFGCLLARTAQKRRPYLFV